MEMNYCRRCGTELVSLGEHRYECKNSHPTYANCSPTVGLFILTADNEVLLSVRGIDPHKGMLDCFGGFLDGEETIEHALEREMEEEVGLTPDQYEQPKYLISAVGHYPFADETLSVITCMFWTRLLPGATLLAADDVASVETLSLHSIDLSLLHDDDVRAGIKKLRELFPVS